MLQEQKNTTKQSKRKQQTNNNTMSKTTTTTATATEVKKPSGKLPENLYFRDAEKNICTKPTDEAIASIVKMFGVEDIDERSANDVVKILLLGNIRAYPQEAEIPNGLEDVSNFTNKKGKSIVKYLAGFAAMHIEAKKEIEEQKNTIKQAEKEKREAEKAAKAEEDKRFQAEADEFAELVASSIDKKDAGIIKNAQSILGAVKFSDKVVRLNNGMGIKLVDGATKADIAAATAVTIAALEGTKQAEGAMQFLIGDLVLESVRAGIHRTKGDAVNNIKHAIAEKTSKKYEANSLNQYVVMAERVPAEKRVLGIKPSYYLEASKVTVPRVKGMSEESEKKAQAEVEAFREELIADINTGEVNTTELKAKVEAFKQERGWGKRKENNGAEVLTLLKTLFYVDFMTEALSKDDAVTVTRGKESHEYSLAELAEKKEDAYNKLVALLIEEGYDLKQLRKGIRKVEKNGKEKEVPYRLSDPFFVKEEEVKEEEVKEEEVDEDVVPNNGAAGSDSDEEEETEEEEMEDDEDEEDGE